MHCGYCGSNSHEDAYSPSCPFHQMRLEVDGRSNNTTSSQQSQNNQDDDYSDIIYLNSGVPYRTVRYRTVRVIPTVIPVYHGFFVGYNGLHYSYY